MLAAVAAAAQDQPNPVLVTNIDGAISVATARQLSRLVDQARRQSAKAIVIQLNTPGGLVSATRDIIRDVIAAPVPILVYVAPSGARAASAGTFIVYASHLAAMAPGTNLGAATPIQMGGLPGVPRQKEEKSNEPTAAERKAINDVVAFLRSLAQLRGRDLDFAEKAVREAATLTAEEARRQGVVEIVAGSVNDVLVQADGRVVTVGGQQRTLATRDAPVVTVEPDWRTKLLGIITDPNIAFILLLVGIYGLLFEFWSPGALFPGVLGGICLILALIALSVLPVQYGALGLLLLGIALMIGEAFVVIGAAMKARQRPAAAGAEGMIGMRGQVVDWQAGRGNIRVHGEIWSARSDKELKSGDYARVVRIEGLTYPANPRRANRCLGHQGSQC